MEGGSVSTEVFDRAPLTEMLGASLPEEQAREIYRQGEETGVFALLTLARKLGELQPTKPAHHHPFRDDSRVSETSRSPAAKASRSKSRAPRQPTSDAPADRPAAEASFAPLSRMRGPAATMHRYAHPLV